jgi:CheY-like chemotaxis protein
MKILIVDDMQIIAELIASLLEDLGDDFTVSFANNGKEACKAAQALMPDLIIMDWEMPEMSGFDALVRIKKNENTKDIPVIIASAFTDSESIRKALEAGAFDYVRKPIDGIELIARVRSVLSFYSVLNLSKEQTRLLREERQRTDRILKGYLPEALANEIIQNGFSRPRKYKDVSIMFIDLVDYTSSTNTFSAKLLFEELNDIYCAFDRLIKRHNGTKIKTIGDAYLAAAGMPEADPEHAIHLIEAAFDIKAYMTQRNLSHRVGWKIRIGISSGPVYAGLIGKEYCYFDVFGDTINMAARMQQLTEPMKINISESCHELVKNYFTTTKRPTVEVKGKGIQQMYFVNDAIEPLTICHDFRKHTLYDSLITQIHENLSDIK